MRRFLLAVGVLVVACSGKQESPFAPGAPPLELQERFLRECGAPTDRRVLQPGDPYARVRSDYPNTPGYSGLQCRVELWWKDGQVLGVWVLVDNDPAWLRSFTETAVLPLLRPSAQAVVRRELLDRLSTGRDPARHRETIGGGHVTIDLNPYLPRPEARYKFSSAELRVQR